MTEQEWLASVDPAEMLRWIRWAHQSRNPLPRPNDRKLRLYACACVRQIWDLLKDKRSRGATETSERFADGEATVEELLTARAAASDAARAAAWDTARAAACDAARAAASDVARDAACSAARDAAWLAARDGTRLAARDTARAGQANLLRDILGNPYRPTEFRPEWRTPDVLSIAHTAYTERAPDGTLEQDSLLVLSDALEEVGCGDELLTALRSPAARYRGFWALDVILGKE